jgi:hypothetical protein
LSLGERGRLDSLKKLNRDMAARRLDQNHAQRRLHHLRPLVLDLEYLGRDNRLLLFVVYGPASLLTTPSRPR